MREPITLFAFGFLLFAVNAQEVDPERFTFNPGDCRQDEEFNRCGSVCSPTCDNIFKSSQELICTKQCVSGCFCRGDLVRNNDGRCVSKYECKRPLPDGQITQQKLDGKKPSEAFGNRTRPLTPSNRPERGRSLFSTPIKPERPTFNAAFCRADEVFKNCGSVCDDTCTTVTDNQLRPCTLQCVIGCFCKAPLVRGENEACVTVDHCKLGPQATPRVRGQLPYDQSQPQPGSRSAYDQSQPQPGSLGARTPYDQQYPRRPLQPGSATDGPFDQYTPRPGARSLNPDDQRYPVQPRGVQDPYDRYPRDPRIVPDSRYPYDPLYQPRAQPGIYDQRYPSQAPDTYPSPLNVTCVLSNCRIVSCRVSGTVVPTVVHISEKN